MTDRLIFEEFLDKPIFIRYANADGERNLVGYLLKIQGEFLVISTRGKTKYVRMEKVSEFYKPAGDVEP